MLKNLNFLFQRRGNNMSIVKIRSLIVAFFLPSGDPESKIHLNPPKNDFSKHLFFASNIYVGSVREEVR